jgi:outer membrane protein assembly factor BamA
VCRFVVLVFVLAVVASGAAARAAPPRSTSAPACRGATEVGELDDLPQDAKVTRVDVHGGGIVAGDVAAKLQTRVGGVLDHGDLRSDLHWLWQRAAASAISARGEPDGDGYAVTFELSPPQVIRTVDVIGAARAQVPMFGNLEGTLPDLARLRRVTAAATEWLHVRGYPHAEVATRTDGTCDGLSVHVDVALHEHVTIARIAVTGSALATSAATFEHELGTVNVVGGVYDPRALAHDINQLIERHQRRGYVDAFCPSPEVSEARGHVVVSAHIAAGARYKDDVAVEGGGAETRRLAMAHVASLNGHWHDDDALDTAVTAARDDLYAFGVGVNVVTNCHHDTSRCSITWQVEPR